jgi:hypothetical protein
VQVRIAGKVSATVAPVTSAEPALLAVIVYMIAVPGVAVAAPSVLVIERSALTIPANAADGGAITTATRTRICKDRVRDIEITPP